MQPQPYVGWLRRALTIPVLVFAVACGDDDDDNGMDPQNRNPVASISADPIEVPENDGNETVVTLDGSGSTDPDGDALSFSWDVPSGTFVNGTNVESEIAQVTFPGTAPYVVTLTVTDGQGGSDDASFTIDIFVPQNGTPVASISADPTEVPEGDANTTVVTLDGSGSTDPDGDALTFSWDVPNGTFVNGTTAESEIAEVTFPGTGSYVVTLTVTDGEGASGEAAVTISTAAAANEPPTASIAADKTTAAGGEVVTLDASGSTDPEGDPLTFSWDVPSGTFENGTTASDEVIQVSFPGIAPYPVTLTVTDSAGNEDTAQVTISPPSS